MRPTRQETSISRKKLLLIASLIVVSTVLFVIGVAMERSQEMAEGPGAHQEEVSGTPESGQARESQEARERAEAREGEGGHQEPGSQEEDSETIEEHGEEAILGINPESTGIVVAVVVGWLVLAVGLLLFGTRFPIVLILVAVVAVAATILDVREVLGQVGRNNGGVAALAAVVTLLHAAIGILSLFIWREHRTDQRLARGG